MSNVKCKYEVCTCNTPHELCPHPLGWASEEEVRRIAERLCGSFDGHSDGFSMDVAREALRWRDETRPLQAPPASSGSCDAKATPCAAVPDPVRISELERMENRSTWAEGWNACRAAMLAAAERKGVES